MDDMSKVPDPVEGHKVFVESDTLPMNFEALPRI